MRVCVIGSGVVGSSVAFRLSEHDDVDVTVIDARTPGTGTTAVSFAWVNANSKRPRPYFELNYAGMREYDRLTGELGGAEWLYGGGCLSTRDHLADIEGLIPELTDWGYAAESLTAREVNDRLEPELDFGDPELPIAYFPGEFCVDAPRLTNALVSAAAARGARFQFGIPVTAIDVTGSSVTVRMADGGAVSADAVVNAAGPDAPKVGALFGDPVPMASTWGMTALVDAPGHPLGRVVHTGAVDVRPEGRDRLRLHYTPIDERLGADDADRTELAADLHRRLRELVPGLGPSHVAAAHVGVRPIPADELSSVGATPGADRCYEAVTHSGVTLGPLFGRLLADEIVHGKVDPLLSPFRPDRFPGR